MSGVFEGVTVVTNDAWETVTNDRQNRASNQRIETIPQK